MTLLERFDADPCWQAVPTDEIRRALAIAQAVDECDEHRPSSKGWIMRRANELLRGKP